MTADRPEFKDKQQVEAPFRYYLSLYETRDAAEIAARTGLTYNAGNFALSLVGTQYSVSHPDFLVVETGSGNVLRNPYEEILLIHYLTEGVFLPPAGEWIDYRKFQGGSLYYSKFKQRAIDRLAREFGANPALLTEAAAGMPGLRTKLAVGTGTSDVSGADAGVTVEFMPELWVTLLVWAADDEFPASAQILFSDNFPKAFTAEDTAGVCDILISRLKKHLPARNMGKYEMEKSCV